jgi:hypothetical protein
VIIPMPYTSPVVADTDWASFMKGQTLCLFAQENEGVKTEQTPHGVRYVVDGPLTAPDGTRLDVRSVGLTLR